jgi:hypothetical protein
MAEGGSWKSFCDFAGKRFLHLKVNWVKISMTSDGGNEAESGDF